MNATTPPTTRPRRRAFALLIVVMLSVLAGIGVTLMIERQASHTLAAARLDRSYQTRHAGAGIQELVDDWLTISNNNPSGAVDAQGLAFKVVIPSGPWEEIRVYVSDAQGLARSNVELLGGMEAKLAADVLATLEAQYDRTPSDLLRQRGPVSMSLKTMPEELLRATTTAILAEGPSLELANELLSAREQGTLNATTWVEIMNELEIEPTQGARLELMLTLQPTLFWVEAEWISNGQVARRAGGELLIKDAQGPWERSSPFLSWRPLAVDEGSGGPGAVSSRARGAAAEAGGRRP